MASVMIPSCSLIASYTNAEDNSSICGRPTTILRPQICMVFSSGSIAYASSFLIFSAVLLPIKKLYSLRIALWIASSIERPPVWIRRLITVPPRESTDISVVSAPISTIRTPCASFTLMPRPRPAATGLSTRYTVFGFMAESWISMVKFRSCISVGSATKKSAPFSCPLIFSSSSFFRNACILLMLARLP